MSQSWETNGHWGNQEFPALYETQGLLPSLQEHFNVLKTEPD
jgi:hypothetical protein